MKKNIKNIKRHAYIVDGEGGEYIFTADSQSGIMTKYEEFTYGEQATSFKKINRMKKLFVEPEVKAIANFFRKMGYNAVARCICTGQRAKDNALYALNMIYNDMTSPRTNVTTMEVNHPTAEQVKNANIMKERVAAIVEVVLV